MCLFSIPHSSGDCKHGRGFSRRVRFFHLPAVERPVFYHKFPHCCDFTAEQYRQMGVISVPLAVMWNGESHSHFSDKDSLRDFYEQMRGGLIASTSALNPADWAAAMEPFLREEYGVHNVHIGYVGPILGAHTGPGVLGLFHLGTGR